MVKKSGYIWVIFLLILVLIVDGYYQIQTSPIPIWQTGWFLWRLAAFFVILICLFIFYYFEFNKKKKIQLEEYKRKVMETQESEWRIIAGELHDNIGQNLSAANIFLQKNINSGLIERDDIESASTLLVETIDEIRRISQKLYPKQIERLGITVSIQAMMERLASATGIKFDSNIDNIDNVLSKENEIQFFRIIQEMLNNIIKHSKAKKVNFVVKRMVMFIKLYIFDDGVGFNINSSSIGSGLINIDERIRLMKGTYELKTEPNKGTNFEVTIPEI